MSVYDYTPEPGSVYAVVTDDDPPVLLGTWVGTAETFAGQRVTYYDSGRDEEYGSASSESVRLVNLNTPEAA